MEILQKGNYPNCTNKFAISSDADIEGFADDYACFIQASIDLYENTFNEHYLELALETQKVFDDKFFDTENNSGYFYTSSDSTETFVRTKPGTTISIIKSNQCF
jgi:uncharacterized protein YyaL (SSP411 family)